MVLRLLSAGVGLPLILASVWMGTFWLLLLVNVVALVGYREFYHLAERTGVKPLPLWGFVMTQAFVTDGYFSGDHLEWILSAVVFVPALRIILRPTSRSQAIVWWGVDLVGPLYVGFPMGLALMLRATEQGREWLLFTLMIVFITDTGAFLIGRVFGRHRLAPRISPRKTWEGAIGGFLCALWATVIFIQFYSFPVGMWRSLLLSGSISVAGQIGDLTESMLKRTAKVKESSRMIPGHGGVLDRIDSVVFAIVVMYYAARWMG